MMKQRLLSGLDVLVCLYVAVMLRLALVGGFTVYLGPLRISARDYSNLLIAVGAGLVLRRWLRGSFFGGFQLPLAFAVGAVRRLPALSSSGRRWLAAHGLAARVLATALLAGILAVVISTRYPLQGLTGRYFDNPSWSGTPAVIANDREPSLRRAQKDWYSTHYSVEWTGVIHISDPDDYRFALQSDDGSELWLDGDLVVDGRNVPTSKVAEGVTHLAEGFHPIRIRYMHRQGASTLAATWSPDLIKGRRPDARPLSTALLFPARPSSVVFTVVLLLHEFLAALPLVFPVVALVCLAAALLAGCDLLFDRHRASSQLFTDARELLSSGRKAAAYAVDVALLATLALALWVVLRGSLTLPLGIARVPVGTPAAPLPVLWLAALFVLRQMLGGEMAGGFRLPPFITAPAAWWSGARSGLQHRLTRQERRAGVVVAAVVAMSLVGAVSVVVELQSGLTGRYYDNPDWSGDLITTAHDRDLTRRRPIYDFVGSDYLYSVEWVGVIHIPTPGEYRFAVTSDGGSLLWIGDALVVDNSGSHAVQRGEGALRLSAGFHAIRVRYAHNRNFRGALSAEWSGAPAEPFRPLSSATLFPESPTRSRTAYVWFRFSRGLLTIVSLLFLGGLTVVYLFGWHWLLKELLVVEEHHVHIGLLASVALVYYMASFGGLGGYWGFSKLQGFGAFRTMPILLLAALPLLAYRRHRARFESAVTKVEVFLCAHPMAVLGAAGLSVLFFFGLRNEFVNSDGTMYRWLVPSIAAKKTTVSFDEMWEQFLHAWFWHSTNAAFGWSVRVSYQVASSMAGGAFILLLWWYARRVMPGAAIALFVLMVSGGYMQLFFGEVENYSFVAALILAYCLASARFLQGKSSLVVPSAILFLAMTFHMLAGFLLPSLGILYLVGLRRRAYLQIGLAVAASATVLAFAMLALGKPITSLYQGSWGTQAMRRLLLVAVAQTGGALGERAAETGNWAFFKLDRYHWDQYNLLALMFPAHLAVIPLLLGGRIKRDAINVHLLVAALGMAFFQFNYRAQLPIDHDWNLFAGAAFPIALLVSRNLIGAEGLRSKAEIVIGWTSLSFIHSYAWILSNHRFMP